MNFERINIKRLALQSLRIGLDPAVAESIEKDFLLTFIHNSTAIEGNTLTRLEVKTILEDGIAVGGDLSPFAEYLAALVEARLDELN